MLSRLSKILTIVFFSSILLSEGSLAVDVDGYADWARPMEKYGYSWEPHEVKTEDGWTLTLIRVTGRHGVKTEDTEENKNKVPVLV